MKDNEYYVLNELLKLWFNDKVDTPRDHNFFKSVGDFCGTAEMLLRGFLYGDDNIYYQRKRAEPCITFLKEMGILESNLSFEELHRKGKERAMAKTVEMWNSPEVIKAFTGLMKTVVETVNKVTEFDAQKDLVKNLQLN